MMNPSRPVMLGHYTKGLLYIGTFNLKKKKVPLCPKKVRKSIKVFEDVL